VSGKKIIANDRKELISEGRKIHDTVEKVDV